MGIRKWVNRFVPFYRDDLRVKHYDLPQGSLVEAVGLRKGDYEQVVHEGVKGALTGWVHTDDLEDYVRNFEVDCVVIENQTPDKSDLAQYMIRLGQKQVNMCGELCVCYILNIGLGTMLDHWEQNSIGLFRRIFGTGRARGTGAGELRELAVLFGRECVELSRALFQPHIKRARYTIKGLRVLMEHGGVIVSVHIDAGSGLLRGSGVLHWVTLVEVYSERNGLGAVKFYNPAQNCMEVCSWNEFILSAGQPYGVHILK